MMSPKLRTFLQDELLPYFNDKADVTAAAHDGFFNVPNEEMAFATEIEEFLEKDNE